MLNTNPNITNPNSKPDENNSNLDENNIDLNDSNYSESTNIIITSNDSTGKSIYFIFHIIMAFIAIYLSWKCNNGNFDILPFLIALFFPYIYIIYILATRGTCDKR